MRDAFVLDGSVLPLRGDGLTVRRDGRTLLDGVTVAVAPAGGLAVLIGPNGAGKSLLIRTLAGLVVPDAGRVSWGGSVPDRARVRRIGFVFQRPVMLRRSARENVAYALRLAGHGRAEADRVATQTLEQHGLGPLADTFARRLSGGEQQRVALARALALSPEVLFLDEPTANLDPASMAMIEARVRAAARAGTRVLLVTQDLAQARRLADEIVFMHGGRIVERGPATSFLTGPATAAARAFLAGEILV
jgi:tungstate transport system ATP-binding protein